MLDIILLQDRETGSEWLSNLANSQSGDVSQLLKKPLQILPGSGAVETPEEWCVESPQLGGLRIYSQM